MSETLADADAGKVEYIDIVRVNGDNDVGKNIDIIQHYFAEKRGVETLNCRSDLKPNELNAYLPYIEILAPITVCHAGCEQVEDAKFRLVGTKLDALHGEATGKLMSEIWDDDALAAFCGAMNYCTKKKAAAVFCSPALLFGRTNLKIAYLMVPFKGEDGNVCQFLVFADICRVGLAGEHLTGDNLPDPLGGYSILNF